MKWRPPKIDSRSHLSCYHWPERLGPYRVVDVMFSNLSRFSQRGPRRIWPDLETLLSFVGTRDFTAADVQHYVRYYVNGAAVFRIYIKWNES